MNPQLTEDRGDIKAKVQREDAFLSSRSGVDTRLQWLLFHLFDVSDIGEEPRECYAEDSYEATS